MGTWRSWFSSHLFVFLLSPSSRFSSAYLESKNLPELFPYLFFCVLYSFTDYVIHWQSFNLPLRAGPTISGSSQDPSLSPGSVPLWMHMCPLWMHLFSPKAFSKLENSVSLFLLLHAQRMWVAVLLLWSWTELGPNPSLCFQICKIAIYKYITHKAIVRTEWNSEDEMPDTSQGQNRPQLTLTIIYKLLAASLTVLSSYMSPDSSFFPPPPCRGLS